MQRLLVFAAVLSAAAPLSAADGVGICRLETCSHCGRGYCESTVEMVKATETCWEVEEREICVPGFRLPFRLPWCDHHDEPCRGRVRRVKVLVEKEFEVERPEWTWHARTLCPDCEWVPGPTLRIRPPHRDDYEPVPN